MIDGIFKGQGPPPRNAEGAQWYIELRPGPDGSSFTLWRKMPPRLQQPGLTLWSPCDSRDYADLLDWIWSRAPEFAA